MDKNEQIRQDLQRTLDDAQFCILIDDMLVEEGRELLAENERLLADETFTLPKGMDKRMTRLIKKRLKSQEEKKNKAIFGKVISRVAVVFLALCCAFAIPFMTVSAFRSTVMNFVADAFDDGVWFGTREEDTIESTSFSGITWVPDGFELVYSFDDGMLTQRYENDLGDVITYMESFASAGGMVDSEEGVASKDLTINGKRAVMTIKDGAYYVTWLNPENGTSYLISANGLDEDAVIKIAESVEK